jgi:putative hydrolase of HD superfamily
MHDLLERLNSLKQIPRMGWLECAVPLGEAEDVAQHSFETVSITLLLLDELEQGTKKLDRERALTMAVVHDWAEALTGDFSYPIQKWMGTDNKERMEHEALKDMVDHLPRKKEYLRLWEEYNEKRTPEARLVRAADYLSLMVQAIKYRERGNRSKELDELWRAVHGDLKPYVDEFPPVKELIEELDERYRGLT